MRNLIVSLDQIEVTAYALDDPTIILLLLISLNDEHVRMCVCVFFFFARMYLRGTRHCTAVYDNSSPGFGTSRLLFVFLFQ